MQMILEEGEEECNLCGETLDLSKLWIIEYKKEKIRVCEECFWESIK